jgi:hypothetical protein
MKKTDLIVTYIQKVMQKKKQRDKERGTRKKYKIAE